MKFLNFFLFLWVIFALLGPDPADHNQCVPMRIPSVADPGCLSRIPDPHLTHPGSRISNPGSKNSNKREGWKNLFSYLFCSHKFHKIEYYFIFDTRKKKIWPNFPRIIEAFTQKIVTKLSKIWVWDPGSETRDPEKTYSGSRIQGSKRHRIPDPDPQHRGFRSGSTTLDF